MTEEEFIEKIKEINVTVPDEIFFLEYNKCVYDILKENQKYKEVFENVCSLLNDYEMQNDEIISSYCKEIRNAMKEVE